MWERFRKAGGKAGRPALDLLLGIRALQGLFAISFAFLALEWIRSRQLPYEFLLYGLSIELFLFVMLWSPRRRHKRHPRSPKNFPRAPKESLVGNLPPFPGVDVAHGSF